MDPSTSPSKPVSLIPSREDFAAVSKCDPPPIHEMGCISGQIAVDRNFVPLLQGVLRPALPREPVRASRLTFPVHGVAVGIRDVHVKEYMRILPGDVRNHAFQGDWLRRIEFARKSVMRKSRHSGQKLHARYDGEEFVAQSDTLQLLPPGCICRSEGIDYSWLYAGR